MASDNRDWYREFWRKKTRYVERARFRMSEADYIKARRWQRVKPFAAAAIIGAISLAFMHWR